MAKLAAEKLAAIKEQKRKADEAWKLASKLSGGSSDADRMREKRAAQRCLKIPDVANPERRAKCEADDVLWLRTYCPDVFYNPFTPHQMRIIAGDVTECTFAIESKSYGESRHRP